MEDLDLDDSKDDSSIKSNRYSTPSHSIVIDCDDFMKKPHPNNQNIKTESKENKLLESSTIVDLLIKKASNLTARDRNNLLKFLSNIDDDDENDDKIRKDNQFLNEIKN